MTANTDSPLAALQRLAAEASPLPWQIKSDGYCIEAQIDSRWTTVAETTLQDDATLAVLAVNHIVALAQALEELSDEAATDDDVDAACAALAALYRDLQEHGLSQKGGTK